MIKLVWFMREVCAPRDWSVIELGVMMAVVSYIAARCVQ